MKFVDQNGNVILNVPDDVTELLFPELKPDVVCVNLNEGLRRLKALKVLRYRNRGDLAALRGLVRIEELGLTELSAEQDISPLTTCTALKHLRLIGLDKVDVAPLAVLQNLEHLMLDGSVKNLKALASLQRLKSLSIMFNKNVLLKWFKGAHELERLNLTGSRIADWESLQAFQRLTYLDLGNTNIESLKPLASLAHLTDLDLGYCRKLTALDGIGALKSLRILRINDLKHIESLRPLAGLPELREIYCGDPIGDGDLSPLLTLPALKVAVISSEHDEQVAELAAKMPACELCLAGPDRRLHALEIHGPIHILRDTDAEPTEFYINQPLTHDLNVETHDEAEDLVIDDLEQHSPELLEALKFDSEGEAFVVRSPSLEAIRGVAASINRLSASRREREPKKRAPKKARNMERAPR